MSSMTKLVESIKSNKVLLDELCDLYDYNDCEREVVAEVLVALAFKNLQEEEEVFIQLPKVTLHFPKS